MNPSGNLGYAPYVSFSESIYTPPAEPMAPFARLSITEAIPLTTDTLIPLSLQALPASITPSIREKATRLAVNILALIDPSGVITLSDSQARELRERQWEYEEILQEGQVPGWGGRKKRGDRAKRCLVQWSPIWLSSAEVALAVKIWSGASVVQERLVDVSGWSRLQTEYKVEWSPSWVPKAELRTL